MPFFKRKLFSKNSENKQTANLQNGVGGIKSPVSSPPSFVQVVPPLQNFVPPPDLIVDSLLGKSNRRSASTVAELQTWAGGYFSAFLRHEGAEDLFLMWERISPFTEKLNEKSKSPDKEDLNDEALKLKSLIEASSTVMSSIEIANVVDGNLNEDDKDCVSWIKTVYTRLYDVLQTQYLPRYLESKFHIKCQVDMFTNCDSVTLLDILLNQNVLFYFMEYVDQEEKREVLEFLMAALNFSEQFKEGATESEGQPIDFKMAESDAMVLYEKYISLQAPHPLGIRDEVRSDVERLICSKEEIEHCFDRASIEAFAYLQVTCLDGFLKSSLYLAFLSDLIGSLSAAKTPQANMDSGSISSTASTTSTSHRSNGASLSSPPTQRKTTLSLGRVTSLGKFEADADLEFVKQGKESSITKTVKKLVNYDEKEKAKEELAWQVAAMIVNEVTSVTMGSGDPNNLVYQ